MGKVITINSDNFLIKKKTFMIFGLGEKFRVLNMKFTE